MSVSGIHEVPSAPAVFFLTLGCPKNEVDTDRMRACVASSAFRVAESLDDADVAVLNTCGFIQDAAEESIAVALELAEWRDSAPGRRLVVAGCLVSRWGSELEESLTEADAFVSVAEEQLLVDRIASLTGFRTVQTPGPSRTVAGSSAYLQVSDGCFRHCTYCTIPAIRGPYRSRRLADLVAEAELLVGSGAREIVLVGQDISSWGRDLDANPCLADVVRVLARLEGLDWLRLMYVQPDGVNDRLLAAMAEAPNVCRYLDMPLQHASPAVLKAMGRSGSRHEFLDLIALIRASMPDIVIRTTLIAGFPGETRADVAELVSFLRDAALDYVGVFSFSPEEGTPAAGLPGLPTRATRSRRAQRLRDVANEIGTARVAERVGRVLDVLSEGVDEDGDPVGRWRGQAPEIDGVVLLDRHVPPGRIVEVRIDDAIGYDLEGTVLR